MGDELGLPEMQATAGWGLSRCATHFVETGLSGSLEGEACFLSATDKMSLPSSRYLLMTILLKK